MVNLKPQIYELLNQIPDVEVSFFYPEDWSKLPAVSYYEISNSELAKLIDKDEALTEINIQVDIWSKKSSDISKIFGQVDAKLREFGMKREFAQDIAPANGVYHKTTRYRCVFSSILNMNFQ